MKQRVFLAAWACQFICLFALIDVVQDYTFQPGVSRWKIIAAVAGVLGYFFGIVSMWVQQQRINDLEYTQETFPETLQAALKKEIK